MEWKYHADIFGKQIRIESISISIPFKIYKFTNVKLNKIVRNETSIIRIQVYI